MRLMKWCFVVLLVVWMLCGCSMRLRNLDQTQRFFPVIVPRVGVPEFIEEVPVGAFYVPTVPIAGRERYLAITLVEFRLMGEAQMLYFHFTYRLGRTPPSYPGRLSQKLSQAGEQETIYFRYRGGISDRQLTLVFPSKISGLQNLITIIIHAGTARAVRTLGYYSGGGEL